MLTRSQIESQFEGHKRKWQAVVEKAKTIEDETTRNERLAELDAHYIMLVNRKNELLARIA